MVYNRIMRLCRDRKEKLRMLLENDTITLRDDQVNHIQGAIDEIELFLLTLQQFQQKETRTNFQRGQAEQKVGIVSRFGGLFSPKKSQTSRQFALSGNYRDQAGA
jgi:hypothetical protein